MTEQKNTGMSEPKSSLTEEQVQQKIKEIQAAVESFLNDPRHDRYKECPENGEAIKEYLGAHDLDVASAESYHAAYVELSKEGKLVLFEESKLPPPAPPKVNDELPEASIAVLADQQRARKQVDGVAPASNRDAFARAATRFQSKQVPGGRLHLG
jgi:hypothetical protein